MGASLGRMHFPTGLFGAVGVFLRSVSILREISINKKCQAGDRGYQRGLLIIQIVGNQANRQKQECIGRAAVPIDAPDAANQRIDEAGS